MTLEEAYIDGFCKKAEEFNTDPGLLADLAAVFTPGGIPGYLAARASRNGGGSVLRNALSGAAGGGLATGAVGGGMGALMTHLANKGTHWPNKKCSVGKGALIGALLGAIPGTIGGGLTGAAMNTKMKKTDKNTDKKKSDSKKEKESKD